MIYVVWMDDLQLPTQIIHLIYEYSTLETQIDFSILSKDYHTRYQAKVKLIKTHFQNLDELYERVYNELEHSIGSSQNRIKNEPWGIHEWECIDDIDCPLHGSHHIKVGYIKNPRDVNVEYSIIDGNYSYTYA